MTHEVRIGCSGWNYASWRGTFYPSRLPARRWLEHYATLFDTVEVNNTFYRLPEEGQFERWAAQTPPGFRFAVTMSRRFTGRVEGLETFVTAVRRLGDRLGPVGVGAVHPGADRGVAGDVDERRRRVSEGVDVVVEKDAVVDAEALDEGDVAR